MQLIFKRNDIFALIVFVFFLFLLNSSEEVKVTDIEVPRYVLLGSPTTLKCHFKLDGEKLYSLNWWKDGRQFYQFIPEKEPNMVVFEIAGVKIDISRSNLSEIFIKEIDKTSEGEYKCEVVADAPYFNTHIMTGNLSIIDPPDGPPVIRGQKSIYHPGEIIHLNCTSYRSRPRSYLKWEIFQGSDGENFHRNWKENLLQKKNNRKVWNSRETTSNDGDKRHNRPEIGFKRVANSVFPSRVNKKFEGMTKENLFGDKRKRRHHHLRRRKSLKTYSPTTEKGNKSKYNEVYRNYLINHKTIQNTDEVGKAVITSSMELQLPVGLKDAYVGYLKLRCSAHIKSYVWATEVTISLANVPMIDPQQLPTLHGKESRRGCATSISTSGILIITSYLINR